MKRVVSIKKKGVFMSKSIIVAVLLVVVVTLLCFADQLAWNRRPICEDAAEVIRRNPILISYCSCCDDEHVEVWLVKRVVVATTSTEGFFEVNVFGRRLYKSNKAFREKQYLEPVEYEAVTGDESSRWFLEGIDLAYVYVPTGNGAFRCLAKIMKRDCDVNVDMIKLPPQLVDKIEKELDNEREERMLTRE